MKRMVKLGLRILLFVLVSIGTVEGLFAQNSFSSETELKKTARKNFDQGLYQEALAQYSQLLTQNPQDPNYNFRFGVCLFYTSEAKDKCIKYLETAARSNAVDKEVFYYLALVYHFNFRFDDAIKNYQKFKNVGASADVARFQVDNQIQMCRNGKTLLRNITDLQVLDKKRVPMGEFFRSYDLSGLGGRLILKPEELQTALDKKSEQTPVIYVGKKNDVIYFASYGKDGKNGKDIYMATMGPNGDFGTPVNLGNVINTPFDEDFPFLHPNGKILYFCSKGHNSMGGYDIFKSTWNPASKSWDTPVNLDFAINSPGDDFLFVTDSLNRTAYFSSNRNSEIGKVDVYRINTYRKPIEYTFINGSTELKKDGQPIRLKITIKNATSGEVIKVVTNSSVDGTYSASVNSGIKVVMSFAADDFETLSEVVDVPGQQPLRTLVQTIGADGKKLVLTNRVEEVNQEAGYIAAMNMILDKAKLDVNATEKDLIVDNGSANAVGTDGKTAGTDGKVLNTEATNDTMPVSATKKTGGVSNDDLVRMAQDDQNDLVAEAKNILDQAAQAQSLADEKSKAVADLYDEAERLEKGGDNDKAKEVRAKADQTALEATTAASLARQLKDEAQKKDLEADMAKEYVEQLKIASASNSKEALSQLAAQKSHIEAMSALPGGAGNVSDKYKKEVELKQGELDAAEKLTETLPKDIADIEKTIEKTKAAIKTTRNADLKEGLQGQLKDLEDDKTDKEAAIKANDARIPVLKKELGDLQQELTLVKGVISKLNVTVPPKSATLAASKPATPVSSPVVATSSSNTPVVATSSSNNSAVVTASSTPSVVKPVVAVETAAIAQATQLNNESEKLDGNAMQIRSEAYTKSNKAERDQLLAKANEIEAQAVEAKKKASDVEFKAKETAFNKEDDRLSVYESAFGNTTKDEVTVASLIAEEARSLFEKAAELRVKASKAESYWAAQGDLDEAKALEKQAFEKQEKSQQLFLQNKPDTLHPLSARKPSKKRESYESLKNRGNAPVVASTVQSDATVVESVVKNDKPVETLVAKNDKPIEAPVATNASTSTTNKSTLPKVVTPAAKVETPVAKVEKSKVGPKNNTKQTKEAAKYFSLRSFSDSAQKAAQIYQTMASTYKAQSAARQKSLDSVNTLLASAPEAKKPALLNAKKTFELQVKDYKAKADSFAILQDKMETLRQNAMKDAYALLKTLPQNTASAIERDFDQSHPSSVNTQVEAKAIAAEGLRVEAKPAYSEKNPIPVDPPLPGGIIYKVQIGAFRKPIKQDAFNGLSPLMGEKTPNGFIRYSAGLFKDLGTATAARDKIRKLGYKDAFVVVFKDGKRTNLGQLGTLANLPSAPTVTAPTNNAVASAETKSTGSTVQATDLANVKGVVFTIQIGVYSRSVTKDKLYNLDSIYTESLDNGLKRYTTGNYTNMTSAESRKQQIVGLGIKDAFVIVFKDGKRFVGNEVKPSAGVSGGSKRTGNVPPVTATPVKATASAPAANSNVVSNITPVTEKKAVAGKVQFKVRVGQFTGDVPVAIAQKILSFSAKGLEMHKDDKGATFYSVGSFDSTTDAEALMTEIKAKGLGDCSVIAYDGDKLISLDEANKKLGK